MKEKFLILTTNVLRNENLDGTLYFYKSFVDLHYKKLGFHMPKVNFDERNPAFKFQKEVVTRVTPNGQFEARKFFNNCSGYDVIIVLYDSGDDDAVKIEINFYDRAENSWQVESFDNLADDSWLKENEINYVKQKMKKFFNAYMDSKFSIDKLQDIYLTDF